MRKNNDYLIRKKLIIKSIKIAVGSVLAILIATWLHLQFATSAGIITLLSIVNTKWGTLKLSLTRICTFAASVLLAYIIFPLIGSEWIAYGIFIFVVVIASTLLKLENTISVNAVIGTHFLTTRDFSLAFIGNETLLVIIGTAVAIVLNLMNGNESQKQKLLYDLRYVEEHLKLILCELAEYLRHEDKERNVWMDIRALEDYLDHAVERAYDYQGNTFASHPGYYIHYLEMRLMQLNILHNLHQEIKKVRSLPAQAAVIADYINNLEAHLAEHNIPHVQEQKLQEIFANMEDEPLPASREEFESRAILYHILMDLEEFIITKKRFIENLTQEQRRIYWDRNQEAK